MIRDAEKIAVRRELEAMREQGARRQALSWHACQRLFFDFGVKPSVVAVRELTGTGSASDIPKDIEAFWARIREASHVRAAQGAIPEALETRAGELLGDLYQAAREAALQALQGERDAMLEQAAANERRAREAELLVTIAHDATRKAQIQLDQEIARREQAQRQLALLQGEAAGRADQGHASRMDRETEAAALRIRLADREREFTALRQQHDELRIEAQTKAEYYAAQLKDAIDDAQRRVRPMLVELDNLRAQAATYQAGIKEAGRREFDFMQQLSLVKGRADTLEKLANRQADELAALHRELAIARERGSGDPKLAELVAQLAARGALSDTDLTALGRAADECASIPARCVVCEDGEPELTEFDGLIEISCPECGHSSGTCGSRLQASYRFATNLVQP